MTECRGRMTLPARLETAMNANEPIADRVRLLLSDDRRVEEKKMFGGLGFMLNGNMALAVSKKGELMVRLGKDGEAAARKLPHVNQLDLAHKMGGMLFVPEEAIAEEQTLKQWVDLATGYTATLPAK